MIAFARRASAILHGLLRATEDSRPFLLPANVCPIVPQTFAAAGRSFELVDIDERSLAMDAAESVRRIRTNAFAGLLFVRPYGNERDPTELFAALHAAQPDLLIIDDRCLCRPDCDGLTISPAADVALFSTGYAKFVDLGGGGFAYIRDGVAYAPSSDGPDWLDLRAPDVSWEEHRRLTIEAASASAAHKEALNAIYARTIPAHVQLPPEFQQWRFNIRVPDSGRLVDAAFAAGLFASRHYAALGDFPVAARLHAEIVNLFNDRHFTEAQAQQMAELVRAHLD
jgi:dTDP-4-amino-4,6-dideoxygalactose transaminase